MDIYEKINSFIKEIENNSQHRFTSWELCYQAFGNEYSTKEIKSLHLMGYLCSWGMYRGSSKLLQEYNYMIFEDLVPILNRYMYLRKNFLVENDFKSFLELINEIKYFFQTKKISPTDTLITKIVLGVYGCFPALDNYFKIGFRKKYKFSTKILIDINKLKNFYFNIQDFYNENINVFNEISYIIERKRNIKYPPVKLIDMYFWESGIH